MAFVQSISAQADASVASIAATFGSNVGSGNLICVMVCHGGVTDLVSSVTDSLGTTYTQRKFVAGHNISGSIWEGVTTSGGANTVTATLSSAAQFRKIILHEAAGFDVFDASNGLRVAPEPVDSGNITPSVDGCYLFGCFFYDQSSSETVSAGTNVAWTLRENMSGLAAQAASEDFVQPTAATVNATFTTSPGLLNAIGFIMAHRPAAGPPAAIPTLRTVQSNLRW